MHFPSVLALFLHVLYFCLLLYPVSSPLLLHRPRCCLFQRFPLKRYLPSEWLRGTSYHIICHAPDNFPFSPFSFYSFSFLLVCFLPFFLSPYFCFDIILSLTLNRLSAHMPQLGREGNGKIQANRAFFLQATCARRVSRERVHKLP